MVELLVSVLILAGALFTFLGALGLVRLDDVYTRLHAPTKATTLGVGSLLIASALWFSTRGEGLSLHEVLVSLFLFITAPVSAHLLARAALHLRLPGRAALPAEDLAQPGAETGAEPDAGSPGGSDTGRTDPGRGAGARVALSDATCKS